MNESTLLKLDQATPLPCSIRADNAAGICGKPATVAYAYQVHASPPIVAPGMWMIQPVCQDCAQKMQAIYT